MPKTTSAAPPAPSGYFAIQVVDDQTGRGVPLVELQTTSHIDYYTDSNGLVAFYEPGLMNKKVFFSVSAVGYEYPADGLGIRGAALMTRPGGSAQLKIKRINIAERLYRITGEGIYRDTVLLGRKAPIAKPLINAEVMGQDSVLDTVYHGKIYWFYGDTDRLGYALGNFHTTGATSALPDKIDPSVGFDLNYFVGADGFARAMAPMEGEGVVWISAVVVLPDETGRDRMAAFFSRRRGLGAALEDGFLVWDDKTDTFKKYSTAALDPPFAPTGPPFRVKQPDGTEYIYFSDPYPALRVRANLKSYTDLASYEGYSCLKPGTHYEGKGRTQLDRDAQGKLIWAWKKDTPPLSPHDQDELITAGKMTRAESPFRLQDAATGKPILLQNSSCDWNPYRKKYILIAAQEFGDTVLGELWYSEADHPEGPWVNATKIITHGNKPGDAHSFYNPVYHSFFDQDGGRLIYLEGTYVNTFSGNSHTTPRYEYNQIMYRLDLADPRLRNVE